MKEKFNKKLLTGPIHANQYKGTGAARKVIATWITRKENVIIDILRIIDQQDGPITLRSLFYKMVSQNLVPNHLTFYFKIGMIVKDMQYSGIMDWNAIKVDSIREMKIDYSVDSIPEALTDTIASYKRNRQDGQVIHIEIWSEKNTLADDLRTLTDKYHLPLCIASGRESSPAVYEAYQRIRLELSQGKSVKILYVGDHDPCGMDMVLRDIPKRLNLMLRQTKTKYQITNHRYTYDYGLDYQNTLSDTFDIIPVALTIKQVREYNLPHNPAKEADPNYKWYCQKFKTSDCWEIDALDKKILLSIVEKAVLDSIDEDKYNKIVQQENTERQALKDFIDNYSLNT